jgi:mRNA interferase RelE/StbE
MFEILFHSRAQKSYNRLDAKRQRQINRTLESLRRDPLRARNVAPLRGELAGLHRIRIGDSRIVIEIQSTERLIIVLAIGSRGDIYKK